MILVRAMRLSAETVKLADELAAASGEAVAFVLDGRYPVTVPTARCKVLLTEPACRALGLFCPPNVAWLCGDYGLYLARRQFPAERHFWLIEHDVRLAGGPPAEFFAFFERHPGLDLLACQYRRATPEWGWYPRARASDATPHRCLFGIVRVSARALDALLDVRRSQSGQWARRKRWPNDEAFVATTLSRGAFDCRDINGLGRSFYDDETLSLTTPLRGEALEVPPGRVRIYHPVLFGEDFERGNVTAAYLRKAPRPGAVLRERIVTGALGALLATQPWDRP